MSQNEGLTAYRQKDFEKAKEYFQMGANLDNDSAHYNLALMYQSAIGIPEDMPKAI
jgi:TPR repeat protein